MKIMASTSCIKKYAKKIAIVVLLLVITFRLFIMEANSQRGGKMSKKSKKAPAPVQPNDVEHIPTGIPSIDLLFDKNANINPPPVFAADTSNTIEADMQNAFGMRTLPPVKSEGQSTWGSSQASNDDGQTAFSSQPGPSSSLLESSSPVAVDLVSGSEAVASSVESAPQADAFEALAPSSSSAPGGTPSEPQPSESAASHEATSLAPAPVSVIQPEKTHPPKKVLQKKPPPIAKPVVKKPVVKMNQAPVKKPAPPIKIVPPQVKKPVHNKPKVKPPVRPMIKNTKPELPVKPPRKPEKTESTYTPAQIADLTKVKGNTDIVLYNRVTNGLNILLSTLFHRLGILNRVNVVSSHEYHSTVSGVSEQRLWVDQLYANKKPMLYDRHMNLINFDTFKRPWPVYINIVRDPIDLLRAMYDYERAKCSVHDHPECKKEIQKYNLDTCVQRGMKFCKCTKKGGCMRFIPVFCGSDPRCQLASQWALDKAKQNVIDHYTVVGVTEQLSQFFEVLEKMMPNTFRSITRYNDMLEKHNFWKGLSSPEENNQKLASKTIQILRDQFKYDYAFYNFIKERFKLQYNALYGDHKAKNH